MTRITVIGLGAGDIEQLPLGIYKKLKEVKNLFLRTKGHPVVTDLEKEGMLYKSFDEIYESTNNFEETYRKIVDQLFEEVKEGELIYAVPGHPLVAEKTVQLLLEEAVQHGISLHIEGGQSFLDPMFTALKIDPVEGFQLVDATSLKKEELQMRHHIIITQVYDAFTASEVKLTLMEKYPDDYEVKIVEAAGSKEEKITEVKLYELDRVLELNNLTAVYVPPVKEEEMLYHQFDKLREVIAVLRGPNGCPWDKKQTHKSLKKYLVEETYEVLEAIDNDEDDHLIEELGDILLQVMLHAQIGEDEGFFSVDDVIYAVTEKMIRRHPHVFGDINVKDEAEVLQNWEEIKRKEKAGEQETFTSRLDKAPQGLPGLYQAYEFQKEAAKIGFDWPDVQPVWAKIKEEIEEFRQADSADEQLKEFGDILFALVNLARFYSIDPEEAVRATNRKFYNRFSYIEQQLEKNSLNPKDVTLEQLDVWWEEAKKKL
ncbi:nucleoside triphosphate pyrophosphohydrolase [Bacillus taeanensis]|uniref:Nucleoside triphosphate pyrophosphohydrolase n=1 Tax=Bacillus taeanensis TaxID=273032 RepID=A0A366XR94_9BACI|nr:nucleoside triphosphate pyrophosphohydrolase [Bacillus taeanensis]RBW67645.1 nucleoside triphosphate pyrophosphohydrolase [Bacillus taeanensis]